MASLLTLLLFCDFLACRVHTSNLVLLRRMLSDFFAGNEHTLQDFVRLGASVVTVMPAERTSQRHQQEAARLLLQQQQMKENASDHTQLCVFSYLSARVATRNIFWLRGIFQEFCNGRENLLQEFVSRGNEVISLIPVDIQALQLNPVQSAPMIVHNTGRDLQPYDQSEDEDFESDSEEDDDDEIATLTELATVASMPPSLGDLRICIMEVLDRIEGQEPWTQVFDPDTLPMPFSGAKRSKLVALLKKFWADHSRAVWERKFWGPFANISDGRRCSARKSRQAKARRAFEKVMKFVYEDLGAGFFVNMDKRKKNHEGWWYVGPVQDLILIAQRLGLAACLDYMESQAFARFPVVAGSGIRVRVAKSNNGKSKSMWSITSAMEPILRKICAAKAANNRMKGKIKK